MESAQDLIAFAKEGIDSHPDGALTLAYDAARKALTALLEQQGLSVPSGAGSHITVIEAVRSQIGEFVPEVTIVDQLRQLRNSSEYPTGGRSGVTPRHAEWAVEIAETVVTVIAAARPRFTVFVPRD